MEQCTEDCGETSKPDAVPTSTVVKVAAFTFGEDELPSKETVNVNGQRRLGAHNAKTGPLKVSCPGYNQTSPSTCHTLSYVLSTSCTSSAPPQVPPGTSPSISDIPTQTSFTPTRIRKPS
ncbi:hypothetical protein EV359DRAFT_83594 [Lentinula novae-zelandiae]|nr:hypothetical protein EV359DRAFT_83594 [Lentinula novae-zelandiae]